MKGFSPLFFPHEFHEFTRITKRLDNGDLFGRTNFHKFNPNISGEYGIFPKKFWGNVDFCPKKFRGNVDFCSFAVVRRLKLKGITDF